MAETENGDLQDLILVHMGWRTESERDILRAAKERLYEKARTIMLKRERDILDQEIRKREP